MPKRKRKTRSGKIYVREKRTARRNAIRAAAGRVRDETARTTANEQHGFRQQETENQDSAVAPNTRRAARSMEGAAFWRPEFEHDACGTGFIAHTGRRAFARDHRRRTGDLGTPRASRRHGIRPRHRRRRGRACADAGPVFSQKDGLSPARRRRVCRRYVLSAARRRGMPRDAGRDRGHR